MSAWLFRLPSHSFLLFGPRDMAARKIPDQNIAKSGNFGYGLTDMTRRRSYRMQLLVNGRLIEEVVVDPHYETKHPDISDELILKLVTRLDGKEFQPEEGQGEWEFYMLDRISCRGKRYRLVWCLRDASPFLGVINCFRR